MGLIADIGRAVAQLRDPRFVGVLIRALVMTILGLAVVGFAVVLGLGAVLPETVTLPWVGPVGFVDNVASWAAVGLMLLLSVFLMVPTAAAVVGFFLEDVAAAVEARHYPALPPARSPGIAEQVADAVRFFALVVVVNLGALLVYVLIAPLAPFVFWLVNGYLLGREYFQLVALRRLDPGAATALRRRNRLRIWLAGTAMAVPLSVPLLNLLVPVVGVAVFTHQFHRVDGTAGRGGGGPD